MLILTRRLKNLNIFGTFLKKLTISEQQSVVVISSHGGIGKEVC